MSKIICSVDFGSTNVKSLLMEVNNDIISIKNKKIFLKDDNVETELFDFINKNVCIDDLEVIVVTGAGSSFFELGDIEQVGEGNGEVRPYKRASKGSPLQKGFQRFAPTDTNGVGSQRFAPTNICDGGSQRFAPTKGLAKVRPYKRAPEGSPQRKGSQSFAPTDTCGGGSQSFAPTKGYGSFTNIKLVRVDEFEATSIGGIVLSKVDRGIVANIGTGTSFVYGDIEKYEYLGGTGLGGGTFVGLAKSMGINMTINEMFDMAYNGDFKNVDLMISDISKNEIENLKFDITASNFAKENNSVSQKDILAGLINMITQNIGLQLSLIKKNFLLKNNLNDIDIILTGGFLNHSVVKKYFNLISEFTNVKFKFVDCEYSQFSTCIGAYEYYLIKIRENKFI